MLAVEKGRHASLAAAAGATAAAYLAELAVLRTQRRLTVSALGRAAWPGRGCGQQRLVSVRAYGRSLA